MPKEPSQKQRNAGKFAANSRWGNGEKDARAVIKCLRYLFLDANFTTTKKKLLAALNEQCPRNDWTENRLINAGNWCKEKQADPGKSSANWNLQIHAGGNQYKFVPSGGRNKRGVGDVGEIVKLINFKNNSTMLKRVFNVEATHAKAINTCGSIKGHGTWAEPDLVIHFFRTSRSRRPFEVHTVEVEELGKVKKKSKPQEVAQSFVTGRGADRSWLMFDAKEWTGKEHKERLQWVSGKLGVGLIRFGSSSKSRTWKNTSKARRRQVEEDHTYRDRLIAQSKTVDS